MQRRSNTINLFGRKFKLPGNRWMRMTVGILLILGGCLAILPVFGLWMIPLGLVVLSIDLPRVRRLRRRSEVWTMRRYRRWQQRRHPA
ncbi:hypothetical protein DYI37_02825 [Fulvimarina endophytica]|uniref:Transmembrane protein (PGPGW) n=1 Tax=Fulvimarina endophytica TaxID=2293836 RepID=A0A371XBG7_9HYPH|nr:hypothetical protein DYI37_02825 [Fulvimarina endophytica]